MITKDNFKDILLTLGFDKASVGEYFTHSYESCSIHVEAFLKPPNTLSHNNF